MIFVTGGTGLVGCHLLVELAKKQQPIRALKRKTSNTKIVEDFFTEQNASHNYSLITLAVFFSKQGLLSENNLHSASHRYLQSRDTLRLPCRFPHYALSLRRHWLYPPHEYAHLLRSAHRR